MSLESTTRTTEPGFTLYSVSTFDEHIKSLAKGNSVNASTIKFLIDAINEFSNHKHTYKDYLYIEMGNASEIRTNYIIKETEIPVV